MLVQRQYLKWEASPGIYFAYLKRDVPLQSRAATTCVSVTWMNVSVKIMTIPTQSGLFISPSLYSLTCYHTHTWKIQVSHAPFRQNKPSNNPHTMSRGWGQFLDV